MPNPTPEERDRETAPSQLDWQAAAFIANRHSKDYGYAMDAVGISLLSESIAHALSTVRREGEAKWEAEAAVLREALELMPYVVPQDRVEVMRQKDPLYTGHDPLYGDAPKWYPVSVLVDAEKLVRIREALSSTTAGADYLKRLEDAKRKLAIWEDYYPKQVKAVESIAAKEPK